MIGSIPLMAASAGAALAMPKTKMKIYLSCGAIGVKASMSQALDYAAKYDFEAIEADAGWLASASESDVAKFLDRMKEKNLVWAQAGLGVEFRKSEAEFKDGMKALPATAKALKRAGVERVGTWLMPMSSYLENFKQHARRLREVAAVLGDHGCRLGMEYVGPKTLWASSRYTFIHTMREMKELIAEMGKPNVGIVLDTWHWYTAGETTADLKTLTNHDIVSVDMNDAPTGIPVDQQQDGKRELACATGVIDVAGFLNALNSITAMKKAFALIA